MGFVTIVEIGGVVSDLIGNIDKLCLKRRTKIKQVLDQFRMLLSLIIVRVFDDPLADFESQIEPAKGCIACLKVFHDAQGVQIMVKKISMLTHGNIERLFTRVAKRRMADIMHQSEGLNQVDIQAELRRNRSRDLRNFQGVGQTITKMIGMAGGKNLGFRLKPAKSSGVDDAIAVPLKV